MEITVLLVESQTGHIELPAFGGAEHEIKLLRVTTLDELTAVAENTQLDLVIGNDGPGWPAMEACKYLQQSGNDVPFVLLLGEEDAEVRRQALSAGVWHTAVRSQPELVGAVLSRSFDYAVARRERLELQKALARVEDILQRNQKSMAMGVMLGSIAHEINNPLEGMANLLYLARRSPHDQQTLSTALEMAEAELNRVSAITKQMLTFHRESERPKKVCAAEILEAVLAMFTPRLREKQTNVVRQFRSPGWMLAQPGELRQLFVNLLANALDSMESGGTLTLRVRESAGPGRRLCVSVGDTGQGMSRAMTRNIGNLFFTTKGESGTGLGMWVVHRIVKKYDGGLCVHSSTTPGRSGTVFRLCFREPHALFLRNQPSEAPQSSSPVIREKHLRLDRRPRRLG